MTWHQAAELFGAALCLLVAVLCLHVYRRLARDGVPLQGRWLLLLAGVVNFATVAFHLHRL